MPNSRALVPYKANQVATKKQSKAKSQNKLQHVVVEKPKLAPRIPRTAYGKGRSQFIAMPYTKTFLMDTGAAPTVNSLYAQNSFRLNSIALPFVGQAASGVLPQSFNSLQNVYKNYKVYACKIRVEWFNPVGTSLRCGAMLAGSEDGQDLGVGTSVQQMEPKLTTYFRDCSDTGDQKAVFTKYVTIRGMDGLDKNQFNADMSNYYGIINDSVAVATVQEITPTLGHVTMRQPKLHLAISPTTAVQTTVQCKVDLIYYTKVYNKETIPITLSQA